VQVWREKVSGTGNALFNIGGWNAEPLASSLRSLTMDATQYSTVPKAAKA